MQQCGCASALLPRLDNQSHVVSSSEDTVLTKRQRANIARTDIQTDGQRDAQTAPGASGSGRIELEEDTLRGHSTDNDDDLNAALKLSMGTATTGLEAEGCKSDVNDVPAEEEKRSIEPVVGDVARETANMTTGNYGVKDGRTSDDDDNDDFVAEDTVQIILASNRDENIGEISSRQQDAENAVVEMFRCRKKKKVLAAIDTLLMMVMNMIENPGEDKFKKVCSFFCLFFRGAMLIFLHTMKQFGTKVRLSNKKFHSTVGSLPGTVKFLLAIGFKETGNEMLSLTRNDPGLLWLGRSILVQIREVTGC
jgi:hypothetical protein